MVCGVFPDCWVLSVVHELAVRVASYMETIGRGVLHAGHLVGRSFVADILSGAQIVVHHVCRDFYRLGYCAHEIKRLTLWHNTLFVADKFVFVVYQFDAKVVARKR